MTWEDIGIEITVPPGAVPKGAEIVLRVRPCLSGPFVIPKDYDLTSPVYMISQSSEFSDEIQLSMAHFANLQSEEDCEEMTFLTARPSSVPGEQYPKYQLKVLQISGPGVFHIGTNMGTISLKHFCPFTTGRRHRKRIGEEPKEYLKRRKGIQNSMTLSYISCSN